MIGAAIKIERLAELGKTVSFNNNFKPSARGCNKPKNPTTFGPLLLCIDAITLRSNSVKYATAINKGTIINIIFIIASNATIIIYIKYTHPWLTPLVQRG